MKTMKALVKARPERGLWMQEVPVPEPGLNDVIVKIKKSAICGTDLHIYKWDEWSKRTIKTPMVIGHEYMGTIEKMGAGVTNLKLGERVTGEGHLACGHCRNCRRGKEHVCENSIGIGVHIDGSFAEFLKIPACNVIPLDNRITDDWAAIMDPFGNATHTALSFPLLGEDVLITGAGLIGSMAVAIARFAGARFIVASDLSDYRLQIAKKMGATLTVNPSKGEKISDAVKLLKMRGLIPMKTITKRTPKVTITAPTKEVFKTKDKTITKVTPSKLKPMVTEKTYVANPNKKGKKTTSKREKIKL